MNKKRRNKQMNLKIHRGTHEIGGTCIELKSGSDTILLDFGMPLTDKEGNRFDSNILKNKSIKELVTMNLLPDIPGLYPGQKVKVKGILITHPHQDHYGMLPYVNPKIPVYMSKGCKKLIETSVFFNQTSCKLNNTFTILPQEQFNIGDFNITPYQMDHSGFDALGYLIECEGKKIFYTGDFRGHGRKNRLFKKLLNHPPKNIDYLITEGTNIGRESRTCKSEDIVEQKIDKLFKKKKGLVFTACSSQNIDTIVSLYRACLRNDQVLVLDPYSAYILDSIKECSKNIPQFDWTNIKIFFIRHPYTDKICKEKDNRIKFGPEKISFDWIKANKNRVVIMDSRAMREYFAKWDTLKGSKLLYSLWNGYIDEDKEQQKFWKKNKVRIKRIHTSGHAYPWEAKQLVKAIDPDTIIPVHTSDPTKLKKLFGRKVKIMNDGEELEI